MMIWRLIKAESSQKVNDSQSKGHSEVVAKRAAHHSLTKQPLGETIGLEPKFGELCERFEMDEVGIIGVCGMAGVGKTTLLKRFHNEFLPTTQHDPVIWVGGGILKKGDVAKIQETIKTELNIGDHVWKNKTINERGAALYNILKRKDFMLIIDDLRVQIRQIKDNSQRS